MHDILVGLGIYLFLLIAYEVIPIPQGPSAIRLLRNRSTYVVTAILATAATAGVVAGTIQVLR